MRCILDFQGPKRTSTSRTIKEFGDDHRSKKLENQWCKQQLWGYMYVETTYDLIDGKGSNPKKWNGFGSPKTTSDQTIFLSMCVCVRACAKGSRILIYLDDL